MAPLVGRLVGQLAVLVLDILKIALLLDTVQRALGPVLFKLPDLLMAELDAARALE